SNQSIYRAYLDGQSDSSQSRHSSTATTPMPLQNQRKIATIHLMNSMPTQQHDMPLRPRPMIAAEKIPKWIQTSLGIDPQTVLRKRKSDQNKAF
ncbi:hypothetical protein U1Q18_009656, partial [Sarracenia purpurea var. burkii]